MKLSFLGTLALLATLASANGGGNFGVRDTEHNGGCRNPSVRKEWRSLTDDEKADWISSIKCLAHLPHNPNLSPTVKPDDIPPVNETGSYWDDISYMHMDMNFVIHFTGLFLPWHRWYMHSVESALREKCGFSGTMPYWDWTRDAADFEGATIFAEPDLKSGLGGWGHPEDDYLVHDGGFSYDFDLAYPSPHGLRRNYTLRPWESDQFAGFSVILDPAQMANISFTADKIQALVNGHVGDYVGFQFGFEDWEEAHASVHEMTGGDMAGNCPASAPPSCAPGPLWAPNDPLFFLHHTTVDKVWYDWQNKNPANKGIFKGGSVQYVENRTVYLENPNGGGPPLTPQSVITGEGMFDEWVIGDYLSTTDGPLCYVYADPDSSRAKCLICVWVWEIQTGILDYSPATMAAELPDMITIGKGITVTFLKDDKYETRISVSGVPGDEELVIPLHWHENHDEYMLVIEGKLQITRGSEIKVYGPEDGEQVISRGIPHALKSVGNCVILERTVPDDSMKQLFFRNMEKGGTLSTNFLEVMHNCYYGDVIPSLPGGIRWLEKAFLTLFGCYIAPLLGYQRKIKTL